MEHHADLQQITHTQIVVQLSLKVNLPPLLTNFLFLACFISMILGLNLIDYLTLPAECFMPMLELV